MYEQTLRERDEAQRAYTHARQEVDALLHSLSEMKAQRDQAVANYQNVIRAPASAASGTDIIGWVGRVEVDAVLFHSLVDVFSVSSLFADYLLVTELSVFARGTFYRLPAFTKLWPYWLSLTSLTST